MTTIKRNETDELRITEREYKGAHYIDLRIWYKAGEMVDWAPTKKGVTFKRELLAEVIGALEKSVSHA